MVQGHCGGAERQPAGGEAAMPRPWGGTDRRDLSCNSHREQTTRPQRQSAGPRSAGSLEARTPRLAAASQLTAQPAAPQRHGCHEAWRRRGGSGEPPPTLRDLLSGASLNPPPTLQTCFRGASLNPRPNRRATYLAAGPSPSWDPAFLKTRFTAQNSCLYTDVHPGSTHVHTCAQHVATRTHSHRHI